MDEIIDHRKKDVAVDKEDSFYTASKGTKRRRMTTKGWELCVQWFLLWGCLKGFETFLSNCAHNLKEEPAFAGNWWVPYTLNKRESILKKVKSKYWQHSHKYGIRVPKSVEEALKIDEETHTTYWRNAIEEEMRKIEDMDAFRVQSI